MAKYILLLLSILGASYCNANGNIGKTRVDDSTLLFTENKGQVIDEKGNRCPEILFTTQTENLKIFITSSGIHYQFSKTSLNHKSLDNLGFSLSTQELNGFSVQLIDANRNPTVFKGEKDVYVEHFYLPHCPNGITNVQTYRTVTIKNVYSNIDWVVYSSANQLKYDFIVYPGGNPKDIRIKIENALRTEIVNNGDLLIKTRLGEIRELSPVCFSNQKRIQSNFRRNSDGTIGFDVDHEPNKILTIDPIVHWATYYGGAGDDWGYSCKTDVNGDIYLSGYTTSNSGIATSNGYQDTLTGSGCLFMVKFNSSGQRLWGTYYGTENITETPPAISPTGRIYKTGHSSSQGLSTPGVHQPNNAGGTDAYVIGFTPSGQRAWATYYGGAKNDIGTACGTDANGSVYIVGQTESFNNIATAGAYQTSLIGISDAFVAKLDSNGVRIWGSYHGGNGMDRADNCKTDISGNLYMSGFTTSTSGIATTGAFQDTLGDGHSFFAKFSSIGMKQWGTYNGNDTGDKFVAVSDRYGNTYVTGYTSVSSGFTTPNAFQTIYGGGAKDAFLMKFNSSGKRIWSTYYGGSGVDEGTDCFVDEFDRVYVVGHTTSTTNIALKGINNNLSGGVDAMIIQFDSSGQRIWGTYFGGSNNDWGTGCASLNNDLYISGYTASTSGISSNGFQNTFGGGSYDAFLVKIIPEASEAFITNGIEGNASFVSPKVLWAGTGVNNANNLKVCADGSNVTQIKFVNRSSSLISNIRFIVSNDPLQTNPDSSGKFVNYKIIADTVWAVYEHPKFVSDNILGSFRLDSIKVIDINSFLSPIITIPMNVYRAPALMIHGLWGKNEEQNGAFAPMEQSFVSTGLYPKELLLKADYRETNSCSFKQNEKILPNNITALLSKALNNGFSVGKVDVVAHSMGGLLTRQYIQGQYFNKRNDVHRFISINVPHSGSQVANLAKTNDATISHAVYIALANLISSKIYSSHKCDLIGGAVEDLKVNSQALYDLNFTTLNNNKVPTHAIITETPYSTTTGWVAAVIYAAAIGKLQTVDNFRDGLFYNDKHDFVVALESQRGGLTTNYTSYTNIGHSESKEQGIVIDRVKELLCKNPMNSSYYSNTWYNPVDLRSKTLYKQVDSNYTLAIAQNGYLNISSPSTNQNYDPGAQISIAYNSTNGIDRVLMEAVTTNGDLKAIELIQANGTINYTLPTDAFGKVSIVLIGYRFNGEYVDYDTITLGININANLDSLSYYPDTSYLQVGEAISLAIRGYFNNTYNHNVSFSSGIKYTVSDTTKISTIDVNLFTGRDTGKTDVVVNYLGKSVTVPIIVIPRDTNLPMSIYKGKLPMNKEVSSNELYVYPNPSTGIFSLELMGQVGENISIQVYDNVGKRVFETSEVTIGSTYKKSIDLSKQPQGIYYINAVNLSGAFNKKIIILR